MLAQWKPSATHCRICYHSRPTRPWSHGSCILSFWPQHEGQRSDRSVGWCLPHALLAKDVGREPVVGELSWWHLYRIASSFSFRSSATKLHKQGYEISEAQWCSCRYRSTVLCRYRSTDCVDIDRRFCAIIDRCKWLSSIDISIVRTCKSPFDAIRFA